MAIAVALLWISMGVAIIYTLAWEHQFPRPGLLVLILFVFWLGLNISRGRNWARITLLVIGASGFFVLGLLFSRLMALNPSLAVLEGVQAVLQCTSLYLLFTDPARSWFRRPAGS